MNNTRIGMFLVGLLILLLTAVHAGATTVSIADETVEPGGKVTIPIMVNEITDYGSGTINIEYNSSVVHVTAVTSGPDSQVGACNPNNTIGLVRITAANMYGASGDIAFANVEFTAVGNDGGSTPLNLNVVSLYDRSFNKISATVSDGSITIGAAEDPQLCTTPDPPSHEFESVPEGETRTWTFDVTNCGGGTLDWNVSSNQSWITFSPTSGTDAGTVTVTINTTGLSDGTHTGTVTVTSDYGTETGTISVDVTGASPQLIDLTPTALDIPDPIYVDCDHPLAATISNLGSGDAQAFDVTLKVDGVVVDEERVDGLSGNSDTTVGFSWRPDTTGSCTLLVEADSDDEVSETDESNNTFGVTVDVLENPVPPPSGAVVTIPDVSATGMITVPITIENVSNAGSCQLTLNYDPDVVIVSSACHSNFDSLFANLDDAASGSVSILAYQTSNPGLDGDVIVANVTFMAVGKSGSSTPLNLEVTTLTDATPNCNPITYTIRNGGFTMFLNGDVNGDSRVDVADCMFLAKHLLCVSGFETIVEAAADVNGNGEIEASDCMYLAKHLAGIDGFEVLK